MTRRSTGTVRTEATPRVTENRLIEVTQIRVPVNGYGLPGSESHSIAISVPRVRFLERGA